MIPSVDQCKTEFERARRQRRRTEPLQFADIRWEALDRFLSLGFPTTHDDGRRFTSVAPIADTIFTLAAEPAGDANYAWVAPFPESDMFGAELVFVNGHYMPEASTPADLLSLACLQPLSVVLDTHADDIGGYLARLAPFERSAFVALNTALFSDGTCILIPAHTVVERPIHVRFVSTGEADRRPAMSHPRVLVVLDDDSQATIVESYVGVDGVQYLTNTVTEIVLGENAVLDHYKLQDESLDAFHVGAIYTCAARSATCSVHSISLGGALARNDVVVTLGGEGGKCTLGGFYLADGERLIDNHTIVDHDGRLCRSSEISHGILADRADGVFNTKIIARPDADKTKANQTNRTMVLSDEVRINSKTDHEILANEVDCTQRSAIVPLNEHAVFRLGDTEARRQVMLAFADGVLNRLSFEPFRKGVRTLVQQRLERVLDNTLRRSDG